MTSWVPTPIGLICSFPSCVRAVTGASGSPIVLSVGTAHGFTVGEWVDVNGVLGNTAANGTWLISAVSATTITLSGSSSSGAWTSGGVVTPAGWVALDGASYAWATYPSLRALLGTTYGGTTNVSWQTPPWGGRCHFGVDASQVRITTGFGHASGALAVGALGGADSHVLAGSEFPSHVHAHGDLIGQLLRSDFISGSGYGTFAGGFQGVVLVETGLQTLGCVGTSASSGGGAGHENRHPFLRTYDAMFAGPRGSGPAVQCPIGLMAHYGGSDEPPGWVQADGQHRATASYPELRSRMVAISSTYESGSQVLPPDARGRTLLGGAVPQTDLLTGFPLAMGGQATVYLSMNEVPAHAHGAGTLSFPIGTTAGEGVGTAGTQFGAAGGQDRVGISGSGPLTLSPNSSGMGLTGLAFGAGLTAHANLPPLLVLGTLIHAGAGLAALPIGAIARFPTNTPPSSLLLADGSAVSRTTYARLFARYGTTYGAGNGTTTFNLPNLIGRTCLTLDNLGAGGAAGVVSAATALGTALGAESVALSSTDVPEHRHGVGTLAQSAHASGSESAGQGLPISGTFQNRVQLVVTSGSVSTYPSSSGSVAAQSPNGGATPSHNNLPAYAAVYWVVKAL